MELVMGVLLFGLVIYIKLGMIKEFLAAWKEAKGKAILLFVKNNAFFSIMFVVLILDIIGRLVPGMQTHYKGGSFSHELLIWCLVYLIPTGIGIYFMNKKYDDGKAHIRGATVISSDRLSAQLKNNVSDDCLPITPAIRIPKYIETTHFYLRPSGVRKITALLPDSSESFCSWREGDLLRFQRRHGIEVF
jgi:hypothetical protein